MHDPEKFALIPASCIKMVGMLEMGAPITVDEVAFHPDCWCISMCFHFAPENPEDGKMYLLLLAYLGCPGHSTESHKMVVVVLLLWIMR